MQIYDILMLAVIVAAIAFGAWKGLAWQIASMAAIVLSYLVALNFREPVSQLIGADPPWNVFLAMLILYVVTSLGVWLTFRLVRDFIDRVKLKEFDRHTGAVLGAAKGVILCVIITLFAVTLLGEEQKRTVCQSRSGYYISLLIDKVHVAMPSEIHDVIHPYLHELDEKIDHERQSATAAGQSDSSNPPAAPTAEIPGSPDGEGQSDFDRSARLLRDAANQIWRDQQ
ncbi:MAG: CvpA family protein [Pirellulaceae bacterium]